jgi:hypothetical protein
MELNVFDLMFRPDKGYGLLRQRRVPVRVTSVGKS